MSAAVVRVCDALKRVAGVSPAVTAEVRTLLALAGPVMLTYVLGFSQQIINSLILGHVSAEALASAALGNMYANAFGASIIFGVAAALDTLSSQAYGAGNYARVGQIAICGMVVLLTLCIPVAGVWLLAGKVLGALGQDAVVVEYSAVYVRYLLPGLPAMALYEVFKKHLQALNIMMPAMCIQALGVLISGVAGVVLVYSTPLGYLGAPAGNCLAQWCTLGMMLLYFRKHRAINAFARRTPFARWYARCARSTTLEAEAAPDAPEKSLAAEGARATVDAGSLSDADAAAAAAAAHTPVAVPPAAPAAGAADGKTAQQLILDVDDLMAATMPTFSLQYVARGWREFLSLGTPSAAMLMVEWGAFEAAAIVSGLVSTTALAAHSIIANTASLCFMPLLGISVAAGIRVGQRMGERRPRDAQLTYRVVMLLSLAYCVLDVIIVLSVQRVWGRLFTSDAGVLELLSKWLFLLAIYTCFDAIQCACCGILRGVGRPALAATANVVAYIVVGLPLAYAFAIPGGAGLPGVWCGFIIAVFVAAVGMNLILRFLNWDKESQKAFERAAKDASSQPDAQPTATAAESARAEHEEAFREAFAAQVNALAIGSSGMGAGAGFADEAIRDAQLHVYTHPPTKA